MLCFRCKHKEFKNVWVSIRGPVKIQPLHFILLSTNQDTAKIQPLHANDVILLSANPPTNRWLVLNKTVSHTTMFEGEFYCRTTLTCCVPGTHDYLVCCLDIGSILKAPMRGCNRVTLSVSVSHCMEGLGSIPRLKAKVHTIPFSYFCLLVIRNTCLRCIQRHDKCFLVI